MKNIPFGIFNVVFIGLLALLIILIVIPFNLINLEQAQRIAKWKSEFEQLNYCFSLVNLHEGSIVPTNEEAGVVITDLYMLDRIKPYFNFVQDSFTEIKRYKYSKMNSRPVKKDYKFYFDKFVVDKDGMVLSLKQNDTNIISEEQPLYYMFIDINGKTKPNRIGQDIFFVSIYRDKITALGHNRGHSKLKLNCSPIGSGLYCSEYYLLGGRF